ncbi:hypothetical protein ACM16X_04285 [Haloarcula japonica]|uniref:hypothetical protein n=1 Tax=Haloarcula japonica TaxID=29282 RepID=UPI0039F6D1A2
MSMNTFKRAMRALKSPNLAARGLNRLYYRRGGMRKYNSDGVDIFSEEWDNLIILDACTYGLFKQHIDSPEKLESRISRGSNTREFLKGNIGNRDFLDTVYVTANPQFYKHRTEFGDSFHAVDHVWIEEGWDEDKQTVVPEKLAEHTLKMHKLYPHKRLIAHFLQPHYPFIGNGPNPFTKESTSMANDNPNCWDRIMRGEISVSIEEVRAAYSANLKRVLPTVWNLVESLNGMTIITSDHGNMIGERSKPLPNTEWGHPRGIYTRQLIKVPWLAIEDERREIKSDPSVESNSNVPADTVSDRLKQLGYV